MFKVLRFLKIEGKYYHHIIYPNIIEVLNAIGWLLFGACLVTVIGLYAPFFDVHEPVVLVIWGLVSLLFIANGLYRYRFEKKEFECRGRSLPKGEF